jgi:cell division protein FtsB
MHLKKIGFFSFLIIAFFAINGLTGSIISLWQKQSLITQAQNELTGTKRQNALLKQQLSVVSGPQFVEEEARDKLFLIKPGEGVIVIPKDVLQASSARKKSVVDTRPDWKKWLDLFF